jgi:protein arginine kinase activator
MRCDKCRDRNAVIFLDHVTDEERNRLSLCLECAMASGVLSPDMKLSILPGKVLENLMASGHKVTDPTAPAFPEAAPLGRVCAECGTELSAFLKVRRAGCAKCWDLFVDQVVPPKDSAVAYRGARRPRSKAPAPVTQSDDRAKKIGSLRKKLSRLVEAERYEDAIAVRDALRKLDGHAAEKI